MNRLQTFESFATHPWLHKVYKKLSRADVESCRAFLEANSSVDKGQYEHRVLRLFLDKSKPKRWREIEELLLCAK